MSALRVLQIPETCAWNDYVRLQESHLAALGVEVIRPGLCRDEPGFTSADVSGRVRDALLRDVPDIVHVHWPEMLGRLLAEALDLLRAMTARGARLVQTVYDLAPHEPGANGTVSFIDAVDSLTHGVHFFTKEHEHLARKIRGAPPSPALPLPHPRYPGLGPGAHPARVRPRAGRVPPGVPSVARVRRLLERVEWVALPYRRVWSSGVLVAAAQTGCRILSPPPVGTDGYRALLDGSAVVDPWDDDLAVRSWQRAVAAPARPAVSTATGAPDLPDWREAAEAFSGFYGEVRQA
ncbi:glycosyltransferase [Streptomyces sp. NBC_00190]|uniref:glycosyltransferase n=1 Tax=Streptomyces sp. NBC_00190 TaxID=2903634 RepID=UPI002E2A0048|nr:glycosyltransferase [Streptomyces sp. NBC_00190]